MWDADWCRTRVGGASLMREREVTETETKTRSEREMIRMRRAGDLCTYGYQDATSLRGRESSPPLEDDQKSEFHILQLTL